MNKIDANHRRWLVCEANLPEFLKKFSSLRICRILLSSVLDKSCKKNSSINRGKGFGSIGTDCPIHNKNNSSSIKHTLLSIVQKCEMYGREGIHKEVFVFNC